MKIDFTSKIIIREVQSYMDGGSAIFICKNDSNQEFQIEFVQNVFWEILESHNRLPGRIYLDDKLVDQRSELEGFIIKSLENSSFISTKIEKTILKEKIKYVKSEQYLIDVKKVKTYKRN